MHGRNGQVWYDPMSCSYILQCGQAAALHTAPQYSCQLSVARHPHMGALGGCGMEPFVADASCTVGSHGSLHTASSTPVSSHSSLVATHAWEHEADIL